MCRCRIAPTSGCAASASASCPEAPSSAKAGSSAARVCGRGAAAHQLVAGEPPPSGQRDRHHAAGVEAGVPGRRPPWSGSPRPYASSSSRSKPSMVALRSAATPMWIEPIRADHVGVGPQRARRRRTSAPARRSPPRRPRPGRGRRRGSGPAVWATASTPEAQNRFRVAPGTCVAPAGQQHRGAGDVGALVADLGGCCRSRRPRTVRRVDAGALGQRVLQVHQQVDRGDVVQRSAGAIPWPAGCGRSRGRTTSDPRCRGWLLTLLVVVPTSSE